MHQSARSAGPADAFAVLAERGGDTDPGAAEICHDVALLLERHGELSAAEILHRRAGVLLVEIPTGNGNDRDRITWARSLAANLAAQGRRHEAVEVLRAALVLAEGLLGADDAETVHTKTILTEIRTNYA